MWVDAVRFGELLDSGDFASALELARGELLPEVDEDWAVAARDEYDRALGELLARMARAAALHSFTLVSQILTLLILPHVASR